MNSFRIQGGVPLVGELTPGGNKNAILPMIAAALLTDEEVVLDNVPEIADVDVMLEILTHLGVGWERERTTLRIRAAEIVSHEIPRALCSRLRTSFLFVAPLLHRLGRAKVYPPGGDVIGRRRLDAHIYGLCTLGATETDGFEFAAGDGLTGREMFFDEASVTATEHILMAAAMARGVTTIRNAASEPHVQDLARMLIGMGATIDGLNTNCLTVHGTEILCGVHHRVLSDHVEVGSFLALAAATGGALTVHNTTKSHYWMTKRVFERFGITLELGHNKIVLPGGQQPEIVNDAAGHIPRVDDGPWPQFPSDMMSAMIVLATQSKGTVLFFEKMFESRMYFVDSLIQMGAGIIVCDPHRVVVSGKSQLRGHTLRSPDIRAGMALLIAALCAEGESIIQNAEIIDRGYAHMTEKLRALGAIVERELPGPALSASSAEGGPQPQPGKASTSTPKVSRERGREVRSPAHAL